MVWFFETFTMVAFGCDEWSNFDDQTLACQRQFHNSRKVSDRVRNILGGLALLSVPCTMSATPRRPQCEVYVKSPGILQRTVLRHHRRYNAPSVVNPERRPLGWWRAIGDATASRQFSASWLPVRQRVQFKVATLVCQALSGHAASYLAADRCLKTARASSEDCPRATPTRLSSVGRASASATEPSAYYNITTATLE